MIAVAWLIAQISAPEVNIPKPALTDDSVLSLLRVVFGVMGAVAIIILVIVGLQYNLSLGDPQKVGKAKNAIIYVAVGLAVMVLAFSIVSFILGRVR